MDKLNDRALSLLRAIAQHPCPARRFTHGDASCNPAVIHLYLDRMVEVGLIDAPLRSDGSYTIAEEGRAYLASRPVIVPARTVGPMSTTGNYVPPKWSVRAGADQAMRIASRGTLT